MSKRVLKIALRGLSNPLRASNEDGSINTAYSQTEESDQPEIVFGDNVVSRTNSIASSALIPANFDTDINSAVFSNNAIRAEVATDINSQQAMLYIGHSYTTIGAQTYLRKLNLLTTSTMYKILTDTPLNDDFFNVRTTMLQTTTYLAVRESTVLHWSLHADSDPVVGHLNGFVSIDINSNKLKYYAINVVDFVDDHILGVSSFGNYMILFNKDRVYWSNPLDFTDFTPASGGGGSSRVSEARGPIITAVPFYNGVLLYCQHNIISMSYSGDSSNPWIFREVPNSSGIYITNSSFHPVALVTRNEQTQQHFAYLSTGLSVITESGVQALPPEINSVISNSYIAMKEAGKSTVDFETVISPENAIPILQDMYSYGNHLFFIVGLMGFTLDFNKLYAYNLVTRQWSSITGNWRTVHPAISARSSNNTGDSAFQSKSRMVPDRFTALTISYINGNTTQIRGRDFSFNTRGDGDYLNNTNPNSEILIGNISLMPEYYTQLHTVEFAQHDVLSSDGYGNTLDPDEHRVRVFAFDVLTQKGDTPVEFIYSKEHNKYYGFIEGKNIKLLISGKYFDLSHVKLEVSRGGRY